MSVIRILVVVELKKYPALVNTDTVNKIKQRTVLTKIKLLLSWAIGFVKVRVPYR